MNKFCSHCGREYDITAHFCPSCGCKNEAAPVQVQPQPVEVQNVQPQVQVTPVSPVQIQPQPVEVQNVQPQVQAAPMQVQPQVQVTSASPVQVAPANPAQVQPQEVPTQTNQPAHPQVQTASVQMQPTSVQVQPQVQAAPVQIQPVQPQVQTAPVQMQSTQSQIQTAPVQMQPTHPTTQPQVQPQMASMQTPVQTAPVSQSMQSGPASTAQPQPAMYGNNQTYIDASMYANAPAKPKKNHTWIIVVSVVGGLFLLLIILLVIFISLMLKSGTTANDLLNNNTSSHRSLQELQDYYYADYENADLDSSEFLDLNTENSNSGTVSTEDSSDASTESSSTVSVQSADFQDNDLTFINIANPDVLNLSTDTAYLLQESTPDRQTSLSQSTVSQYTDNIRDDAHYSLGRGIAPGASLTDFCNAYGINSSNSMLQVHSNDAWSYYYFSNPGTLSGLSADAICLTIGWSKKEDTWTRLNVNSLQNYFSSAQDSSDDEVLFYTVTLTVPTDPNAVSADSIRLQTIQVEYGTPDAFYHFYGLNSAEN